MIKKIIPLSFSLILMSCQVSTLSNPGIQSLLTFKPITKDHQQLIGLTGGGISTPQSATGSATGSSTGAPTAPVTGVAPVPAASPASGTADYSYGFNTGTSANSGFYSIWSWGVTFDDYILDSVTESSIDGFTGDFDSTLQKISPYITSWASDARLIDFNGDTDNTGKNLTTSVSSQDLNSKYGYYYPSSGDITLPGWQFNYISSNNREKLLITVTSKEILFIKQKWILKNLATDNIKVNSDKVIQLVTAAIKDPNFQPTPEPGLTITPVIPYWQQYPSTYETVTIINDLPADSLWNLYLYKEVTDSYNGLVWNINIRIPLPNQPETTPSPSASASGGTETPGPSASGSGTTTTPTPPSALVSATATPGNSASSGIAIGPTPIYRPQTSWIEAGYARVDASTGKILSLTRPVVHTPTSAYPSGVPVPNVKPVPPSVVIATPASAPAPVKAK